MPHAIELLLALLTLSGLVYTALALLAARSFAKSLRATSAVIDVLPAVSLLKPLKGADPELLSALESHCLQQYPAPFEILCAVSSPEDPAVAIVAQVQAAHPQVALRLIVCPERLGTSGKVSNLVQTLPHAQYDHLLINDSDIHVGPHYLAHIMTGFSAPPPSGKTPAQPVGMVTAPYIGRAHADPSGRIPLWPRLESLGISTEFLPGVLTARMLEGGIHFGLGSTLAMRRDALFAAGGLEPLLESLADDYELGARIACAGFRVHLAAEVVETSVPPYTFRAFFDHQLRWSRSTRDSRRLGYLGLGITFVVPWAFLSCLASGFALHSLALLSLALLARTALALTVGVGILRDPQVLRDLPLVPLRDAFGLFFWFWSYAGDTVVWRGERFRLHRGHLTPLP